MSIQFQFTFKHFTHKLPAGKSLQEVSRNSPRSQIHSTFRLYGHLCQFIYPHNQYRSHHEIKTQDNQTRRMGKNDDTTVRKGRKNIIFSIIKDIHFFPDKVTSYDWLFPYLSISQTFPISPIYFSYKIINKKKISVGNLQSIMWGIGE